jgi:serine phosphatase RsbU (regulator of sigma subunit)
MIEPDARIAGSPSLAATSVFASPAGRARAGGDWCEVLELSEHVLALVLGDVAGHGEPAARKMREIRAGMRRTLHKTYEPSSVLAAGNTVACGWDEGTLVTAIVAIVDCALHTLTFAGAGHPAPLLLSAAGHAFLEHRPADLPLGVFARYHAADYVISLPRDAMLVLYTDGITEHDRDPVLGEVELVEAAWFAFERPELHPARAIAHRVLAGKRGDDDVATAVLRLGGTPVPG